MFVDRAGGKVALQQQHSRNSHSSIGAVLEQARGLPPRVSKNASSRACRAVLAEMLRCHFDVESHVHALVHACMIRIPDTLHVSVSCCPKCTVYAYSTHVCPTYPACTKPPLSCAVHLRCFVTEFTESWVQVTTRDESGQVTAHGVKQLPSGMLAPDGPPTTLGASGRDWMAFVQGNLTRDATYFVNGTPVGARDIFQVLLPQGCFIRVRKALVNARHARARPSARTTSF